MRHQDTTISRHDYVNDSGGRRTSIKHSGSAFETGPAFNLYGYNSRSEVTTGDRYWGANLNDTSDPVSGIGTKYWGEIAGPFFVNAVKLALTASGSGSLAGSLYDRDHGDVSAVPPEMKAVGVWRFESAGFTLTSADVTFRYDHARAAELGVQESDLKLYVYPGTGLWQEWPDVTLDPASRTLAAHNVTDFDLVPHRETFSYGNRHHNSLRRSQAVS